MSSFDTGGLRSEDAHAGETAVLPWGQVIEGLPILRAGRIVVRNLSSVAEKEKWAASTFNHYRSLMSLSYRPGILKVTTNPARSVTYRREDNNRVRFLTEEKEKNLRKVVEAKWSSHLPGLDLAINTGSQYGLAWDVVDWKSRELHIPRTKNEEPLHVPLSVAALGALKAVFEGGDGAGRVFKSSRTGEPLENGRHWFDNAVVSLLKPSDPTSDTGQTGVSTPTS
jgi:integrase